MKEYREFMLDADDRQRQLEALKTMSEEGARQNAVNDPDCPPIADIGSV